MKKHSSHLTAFKHPQGHRTTQDSEGLTLRLMGSSSSQCSSGDHLPGFIQEREYSSISQCLIFYRERFILLFKALFSVELHKLLGEIDDYALTITYSVIEFISRNSAIAHLLSSLNEEI